MHPDEILNKKFLIKNDLSGNNFFITIIPHLIFFFVIEETTTSKKHHLFRYVLGTNEIYLYSVLEKNQYIWKVQKIGNGEYKLWVLSDKKLIDFPMKLYWNTF